MSPSTNHASTTRHAVILAAGESKRTRPLTNNRPKPLIPLLGKPLLAHILDELVGLVETVTLVVGYRAADISAHFGSAYRGMALRYAHQHQTNGTASALLAVETAFGPLHESFFLLYGDNLISREDLEPLGQQPYSLAGLRVDDARSFGVLELAQERVVRILEKPANPPPDALANPGIYHFGPAAFPALHDIRPSPRGEYELTDLIEMLASRYHVGYHICTGHWVPVGNPWEALSAVQFLLARPGAGHNVGNGLYVPPGAVVRGPGLHGSVQLGDGCRVLGPALLDPGCMVGAGCTLESVALEADVSLAAGCTVERSSLGRGVVLGAHCHVQSSLLDEGCQLGDSVQLPEGHFPEVRATARTNGLLEAGAVQWRGSIAGPGVALAAGSVVPPGSVLAAGGRS